MCTVHMSWFLLSNKPFDAVEENEKCLDMKKSLLFSPIHSFVFIIKSDARPQIIPFQTRFGSFLRCLRGGLSGRNDTAGQNYLLCASCNRHSCACGGNGNRQGVS